MTQYLYLFFAMIAVGAAIHISLRPSSLAEIIWGIIALVGSSATVVIHHFSMKNERRKFGVP